MNEATVRLIAAYQFVAQHLGEAVPLSHVRSHIQGVGHSELNTLLRSLNGQVVDFYSGWLFTDAQGTLTLQQAEEDPDFDEYDGGVEIDGVEYTRMAVEPF